MPYHYPIKFGKYLLTRRIAVGGMAEVFKAKLIGIKGFEKILAVKRILPEFSEDEEFVQMFVDEARISSNLHHSNIVQVFDFGKADQYHYMAMEYVDGPNLKNLLHRALRQGKRLPQTLVIYMVNQVAKALDYAHNVRVEGDEVLNLVHRDVSPQNILVSRHGEVKITDFGIAKATIKLSKTQPGKIQGKFSYMSPEQAAGKPLDRRSDIFSLGIITYELLSGIKVYGAEDTVARYREVREANVPKLSTLDVAVSDQLEALVMRMLSKDPAERPQSCLEVTKLLTPFLKNVDSNEVIAEIGQWVEDLYPKEKSDSSIRERVSAYLEGGRAKGEPETQVDSNRIGLDDEENSQITKDVEPGETTIRHRRRVRPLLIGLLVVLLVNVTLGAVWYWRKNRVGERMTETEVAVSPTPDNTPDSELESELSQFSGGPVDPDIRAQALERQEQFEKLLEEAERKRAEAEEKALEAEKELKETKHQLEIVSAAAVKPPCPEEMVLVPSGKFLFGSNKTDKERNDLVEFEAKEMPIQSFCIDRYEYPNRRGVLPKANVTWNEAQTACVKIGKRLCLQEEWERACKGPYKPGQNPQYPYGSEWAPDRCNTKESKRPSDGPRVAKSGTFASCMSREKIYDLSGNLSEWTGSTGRYRAESRIVRGGSTQRPYYQARCSSLRELEGTSKEAALGFRCCKDAL